MAHHTSECLAARRRVVLTCAGIAVRCGHAQRELGQLQLLFLIRGWPVAGGKVSNRQVWRRVSSVPGRWQLLVDFMRKPDRLAAYVQEHCSTEALHQGDTAAIVPEILFQPQAQGEVPVDAPMYVCTNMTDYKRRQECADLL